MLSVLEEELAEEHEAIDHNQTLMVNFNKFGASSLDFFIYTFTKTTNWAEYHNIKQYVLLKIADIIDNHGAEVAFPTSTIHLADAPFYAGTDPAKPEAGE